jgi:small subunit ribosomal protein S20
MANTSSAKKATRVAARRATVNKNRVSKVRSSVRKVEEAITGGKKADAEAALKSATTEVMRGANKGVMHRNAASRKVSRLTRRVRAMKG